MVTDLTYTDASWTELGVVTEYELDMAWGIDENDFELKMGTTPALAPRSLVYVEGTEWGGVIDRRSVDETTGEVEVVYGGRTWHGILAGRVICPSSGADYRAYNGDANAIIAELIGEYGLSELFTVPSEASAQINGRFDRYCTLYDGLKKELNRHGLRLDIVKPSGSKVIIRAVEASDMSGDYYSDQYDFKVDEETTHVNHLVCLGKGELKEREVVHLYADGDGNVSSSQTFIGADERVAVYNNNNATDLPEYDNEGNITNADDETLTELGTQRLLELQEESEIELFLEDQATACIGDSVGAQSVSTGISVTGTVNKLVLKIGSDGVPVISHEVGKLVEESEEEL